MSRESDGYYEDDYEVNLAYCDYYQGIGTCSFGCSDEPECMTCEPNGGWRPVEFPPYKEFLHAARRLSYRMQKALAWAKAFPSDRPLDTALAALYRREVGV